MQIHGELASFALDPAIIPPGQFTDAIIVVDALNRTHYDHPLTAECRAVSDAYDAAHIHNVQAAIRNMPEEMVPLEPSTLDIEVADLYIAADALERYTTADMLQQIKDEFTDDQTRELAQIDLEFIETNQQIAVHLLRDIIFYLITGLPAEGWTELN